jgi:hypothetical protein
MTCPRNPGTQFSLQRAFRFAAGFPGTARPSASFLTFFSGWTIWYEKCAQRFVMTFWETCIYPKRRDRGLRHDFLIGVPRESSLFRRKATDYYCIHCEWNFLVCGSTVAVLDARGIPLTGTESSDRFNTFEEGPCPVLKALASDIPGKTETAAIVSWRNGNERSNLAPRNIRTRPNRPRPLFRVLGRVREDLGRLL